MATELERLVVRVVGDDTELDKDLKAAKQKTQRWGRQMRAVGRSLTTFVTLPIVGVGVAATKMASDAEEAGNKFEVVMGDAADRVRARFAELHDIIPLTRHEMEGLAAGVQDLLVPLGLARNEAAGMSGRMVELAADIGSFNNVAASTVLEDFKSGLAGMSRPLRKYGVDISKARLETIALEEGLVDAGEEMDTAARALAVMEAITRDSSDAMGDAARTADSAANSFRFLLRDAKELAVTIGQVLLPAVTPLVQGVSDLLKDMEDAGAGMVRWGVAAAGTAAALGPLLIVVGALTPAITALAGAISLSAAPLWALGAALAGLVTWMGKAALDAAALRSEISDTADEVERFTDAIDQMDGTRVKAEIRAIEARLANLREAQERAGDEPVLGLVVGEGFGDVEGITAEIERLEVRLERLKQQAGETGSALDAAFDADVLAEVEGAAFMLDDRLQSLAEDINEARMDLAFASTAEEAEELRQKIEDLTRQQRALTDALQDMGFDPEFLRALERFDALVNAPTPGMADVGEFGPSAAEGLDTGFTPVQQVEMIGPPPDTFPSEAGGGGLMASLKTAAGALGGAMNQLIPGFTSLNPLLAVLIPVVQGVVEALKPAFDALLAPLRAIGRVIGGVVAPVIELLADVVSALIEPLLPLVEVFLEMNPLLRLLKGVLEVLAAGIQWVMGIIGKVVEAIGRFIDSLPFISAQSWIDAGERMQEAAKGHEDAVEETNEALRTTSRVLNAPSGFKVALARFRATEVGANGAPGGGGGSVGGGGGGGGRGNVRTDLSGMVVNIMASPTGDTPEGLYEKWKTGVRRAFESGDPDAEALLGAT